MFFVIKFLSSSTAKSQLFKLKERNVEKVFLKRLLLTLRTRIFVLKTPNLKPNDVVN